MTRHRFGGGYDPHMDRFDVAVRSVARAATGRRALQREVGLSDEEAAATREALGRLGSSVKTEAGVFALLQACPFLLDHALLLLVRYQARCVDREEGRA